MRIKQNRIINILIWCSILTASFDIFLVIDIGRYTIRLSQISMLCVMIIYVLNIIKEGKMSCPLGYKSLMVCVLLNTIYIFRSSDLMNALGYDLWFIFDFIQIFVVVFYISKQESIESLTRKYINCFVLLSLIGILQWILQFFDLYFFVTQKNSMHRINGFAFEPSYYATYLLIGWVLCMYLLEKSNYSIMSKKKLQFSTLVITLALFFSTSRMGWMMMIIYICYRILIMLFESKSSVTKLLAIMIIIPSMVMVCIYVVHGIATQNPIVLKYVQGLGLGGTAAHSSSDRLNGLNNVIMVIKQSPFFGYSLGGVDPQICVMKGIEYSATMNGLVGFMVFAEVFAGLGLFGFLFFLYYIYQITLAKYLKIRKKWEEKTKQIAVAFILSTVFELMILQMNQNILRPYLWIHIALISSVYSVYSRNGMDA